MWNSGAHQRRGRERQPAGLFAQAISLPAGLRWLTASVFCRDRWGMVIVICRSDNSCACALQKTHFDYRRRIWTRDWTAWFHMTLRLTSESQKTRKAIFNKLVVCSFFTNNCYITSNLARGRFDIRYSRNSFCEISQKFGFELSDHEFSTFRLVCASVITVAVRQRTIKMMSKKAELFLFVATNFRDCVDRFRQWFHSAFSFDVSFGLSVALIKFVHRNSISGYYWMHFWLLTQDLH